MTAKAPHQLQDDLVELDELVDTVLADNDTRNITPADLRTVIERFLVISYDTIDSLKDDAWKL